MQLKRYCTQRIPKKNLETHKITPFEKIEQINRYIVMVSVPPFFSIICPLYDVESYIEKTIQSVINQKFTGLELLLVNDNSQYSTSEICNRFALTDSRISLINLDRNFGPGYARNIGIDVARGEYLIFLDGDDYLVENCLAQLLHEIKTVNSPDLIHVAWSEVFGDICRNQCTAELTCNYDSDKFLEKYINIKTYGFFCWEFIFKRNFIKINNIKFRESKMGEDVDFVIKAIIHTRTILESTIMFYIHRETLMGALSSASGHFRNWKDLFISSVKIAKLLNSKSLTIPKREWVELNVLMLLKQFEDVVASIEEGLLHEISTEVTELKNYLKLISNDAENILVRMLKLENNPMDAVLSYRAQKLNQINMLIGYNKSKRIYIFPANRSATRLAMILRSQKYCVAGLLDNNVLKKNLNFDGYNIFMANQILEKFAYDKDFIIIYSATKETQEIIKTQLNSYGLRYMIDYSKRN